MPSQIGDDAEKRTASAIDYLRHALDMLESRLNGDDAASTDRVMLAYARQDLVALEAEIAMLRGTMAQPTTDEPTTYADNLPPNAPPHGERPPDNNQ